MKVIINFLSFLACLTILISCQPASMGSEESESVGDETIYADYHGTVNYYSDSKGIHISIPLEEHKINKIDLYEIQGTTEIQMATVTPVSQLYNYGIDGTPCGEKMWAINGENKTEVRAYYRTNYLEGTINLDLCFVEPGKNYNFLLYLYEPKNISGGGESYFSVSFDRTPKARYSYKFSQIANDESQYSDFIKAEYDSGKDKFTVKPVDIKTLGLPFEIEEYSDITMMATALYKDTLNTSRTQLPVPLTINPDTTTETSLSVIAEKIDDIDFDTDYTLALISGSLEFTEHLEKTITDSSTDDEKREYYTALYSQKTYTYNCPYITCSGVPATVNFPDKRMNISLTPEADDNLVSFTMLTDATMISIYRQSAEEKEPFLAGTMKGSFISSSSYSFPDYYAESGKDYTYFVTWDGERKSKSSTVTTISNMKYKPNAPEMSYKFLSDSKMGVFTVVTNPLTDKLPAGYSGSIDFVYGKQETYYFTKVFDFTVKDSDTAVYISSEQLQRGRGIMSVMPPETEKKESSNIYYNFKNSYFVTIKRQSNNISYTHYYILTDLGTMPKVTAPKSEAEQREEDLNKEITKDDIELGPGLEFYTLKTEEKGDYAELKSVTQRSDGTVEIKLYLPKWTNYARIKREYLIRSNEEIYNKHEWTSCFHEDDGYEYLGFHDADFYIDVFNHTGEITIIDLDIIPGKVYQYYVETDSAPKIIWNNERIDDFTLLNCNKAFEKTSPYYLTRVPVVKSDSEIEGDLVWSKLPAGYSFLDSKKITQQEVTKLNYAIHKNGWQIEVKEKNFYIKHLVGCENGLGIWCTPQELSPSVLYSCTEVTGADKYYKDEYGNQTEKQYDENSFELKYTILKAIEAHLDEQQEKPYLQLNTNWQDGNEYKHNLLSGNYVVTKVSTSFICEYGIWHYNDINLDQLTNKTFSVEK